MFIKEIKKTQHNHKICYMYNYRSKIFYNLYRDPSDKKIKIYTDICRIMDELNGFDLRCTGNSYLFNAYFLYRKNNILYLKHITKHNEEDIEVVYQ